MTGQKQASVSISARVWITTCLLIASISTLVISGLVTSQRLIQAQARTRTTAIALRNHVEGDMMHDALRGQIYAALHAARSPDPRERKEVADEFASKVQWFHRVLEKNKRIALEPGARRALGRVEAPLHAYVHHASAIIRLAGIDLPAAERQLPAFTGRFRELEVAMQSVSNELEQEMAAQTEVAEWLSRVTQAVLWLGGALALIVAAWSTFMLRRLIVAPLKQLTNALARMAAGDAGVEVIGADRHDEIGTLAAGILSYRDAVDAARLADAARSRAEDRHRRELENLESGELAKREKLRRDADEARRRELNDVATALEQRIMQTTHILVESSEDLNSSATRMTGSARETEGEIATAATATQKTGINVQAVATASEQLLVSIADISSQTSSAAEAALLVKEGAQLVGTHVAELEDGTQRIDDISALIASIARQTNLLAMNATIEATRAGEAGRGFSVVATEVKNLASEAEKASRTISEQLKGVRGATKIVSGSMSRLSEIVQPLEEAALGIADAVEQQKAATEEIGRRMQETATGADKVERSMHTLRSQAEGTRQIAASVAASAETMKVQASRLRNEVIEFVNQLRAL